MGMKLQSIWTCERCDKKTYVDMDTVPEGWRFIALPTPMVDATDHAVDISIAGWHDAKHVICDKCVRAFLYWFEQGSGNSFFPPEKVVEEVTAQPISAGIDNEDASTTFDETPAPVVGDVESAIASALEEGQVQ